jgi:hypothetical protein
MLKQSFALGIVGIITLVTATPVKADTATVQSTTQETYINGEYNSSTQMSDQTSMQRRGGGSDDSSTGIVQDTYQGSSVSGYGNDADQRSSQVNVMEEIQKRPRRGMPSSVYIK